MCGCSLGNPPDGLWGTHIDRDLPESFTRREANAVDEEYGDGVVPTPGRFDSVLLGGAASKWVDFAGSAVVDDDGLCSRPNEDSGADLKGADVCDAFVVGTFFSRVAISWRWACG